MAADVGSPPMWTLRTAETWDGLPAGDEAAALTLTLTDDALMIEVDAPFHEDAPPGGPPGPCWGLWEHEAVELFVASGTTYTEIELGPHGHHLVLQLVGVRNPVARELPIGHDARIAGARWTARATVPLAILPPRPWTVNATAVHGAPGARRYLTWAPLGGTTPDFHQLARFRALIG